MFKFLKDKLKSWTEKVANAPQDESSTPVSEEIKEDLTKTPEIKEESKQIIEEIKEIKKEKKKKELPKQKEKTDKEKDEIIIPKLQESKEREEFIEEEIKILSEELQPPKPLEDFEIEESQTPVIEEKKEGFISKLFKKKKEIQVEESIKQIEEDRTPKKTESEKQEIISPVKETIEEKSSIIQKVREKVTFSRVTITKELFEKNSSDLQELLLENNVAFDVTEKIIEDLSNVLVGKEISRKDINEEINGALKEIVKEILIDPFDLIQRINSKKEKEPSSPFIILFCGINGSGKTTSIAKLTNYLKENKFSCVLAAGDTFRAASIEQLKIHGEKLDTKVISQEYGHDPAAVAFDSVSYAKKHGIDVVLIDTAGRMHTEKNLMHEIEKISRVVKPDLKIFVGESITGNDATEQAKAFNYHVGIDGIILSKSDIDEKGGTALSVGFITKKPILFLGTGQNYSDIEKFDKERFIERLGL